MEFNQNRIHRVFQLIKMMKTPPFRTKEQLATSLGCTVRSVYRYMHLLENLGFEVRPDEEGRLMLEGGDLHGGLTPSEVDFCVQILKASAADHPVAESIIRKLRGNGEQTSAPQAIAEASKARVLEQCTQAIARRRQLVLVAYASANTGSIRDRLVEPVNFTHNYRSLSAFEVSTGEMKLFKLDRVADAVLTDHSFAHANQHTNVQADAFGFAWRADQPARAISMRLTLRAGLVLKEEYPLTADHLIPLPEGDGFEIQVPVADYRAPRRFLLGWGNDVEPTGDAGFLDFIASSDS